MSWIARLLPVLADRGWRVQLFLFSDFESENSPMADSLRDRGVSVHVSPLLSYTKEKMSWLFEQVRCYQPDVFVANLVVPAYFAAAWVRKSGIPTVGVLHSDDPFYRAIQKQFVFGLESFRVTSVVCVSKYLEQSVLLQNPGAEVHRIPYGVPIPSNFSTPPTNRFRIAYVGRLVQEQKRIRDLTVAFCDLVETNEAVEATILGDGQERRAVEEILKHRGNPQDIKLMSAIPSAEVQRELCSHHAFILLSDYEGLPIALMEAMACGLVPICLDLRSGIGELIQHEVNGLIVSDRGHSFRAAVSRLQSDTELWTRLSRAARDTVVRGFDQQLYFDKWNEFLSDLAGQSRDRSPFEPPKRVVLPPVDPVLAREDFRGESASRFPESLRPAVRILKNVLRAVAIRVLGPS